MPAIPITGQVFSPEFNPTIDVEKQRQEALLKQEAEKPRTDTLEQPDFSDYMGTAKERLLMLENDWNVEILATQTRRKTRNIEIDVAQLRKSGVIAKDAGMYPPRLIDTNITREMPPFIAYLKQSRRISIFKCVDDPQFNTDMLEGEFTRVCQYDGWELPHYKILDGRAAHGWDLGEVVLDTSKPGHVAIEHVGHDELLFPIDALNIQSCEYITRIYYVTDAQLRQFVKKYGFSPEQTRRVLEKNKNANTPTCKKIRKCMWKNIETGIVWVAWYQLEDCDDWLKAPEPLYLGVDEEVDVPVLVPAVNVGIPSMAPVQSTQKQWQKVYEKSYPYEHLYYYETEERKIFDHKGRVWLDQYKQEMYMAVWTGFINRIVRAENVYACPRNDSPTSADDKIKMTTTELTNGGIYNKALDFFQFPYPDPSVINALQAIDTQNASETNQVAWAVNNRKDSRKTATEIDAATQQNALLNGVQVTLYSVFLRRVYTRVWRIVQSRAKQNKIKFMESLKKQNLEAWNAVLNQEYQIFAAGDVDVIQRQEKLNRKMQFWSVVANTPVAQPFFVSMIKDAFPDEAPMLLQQMQEQQQTTQTIASLGTALAGMAQELQANGQLNPQQQKQVLMLLDNAQKATAQPTATQQ